MRVTPSNTTQYTLLQYYRIHTGDPVVLNGSIREWDRDTDWHNICLNTRKVINYFRNYLLNVYRDMRVGAKRLMTNAMMMQSWNAGASQQYTLSLLLIDRSTTTTTTAIIAINDNIIFIEANINDQIFYNHVFELNLQTGRESIKFSLVKNIWLSRLD